jgi:hypothetical protein
MSASAAEIEQPHRKTVAVLLVVATFLTFVAIFSFWLNRQAMNTDHWVDTSSSLLQNDEIQAQLATFLVTQLYTNVDVEGELRQALPPQARALAGPAAGGLRQLAQQVAERALTTPQVQAIWAEANRNAHRQFLAVVNGGGTVVSTDEGEVTVQLGPVVKQVGEQVGVPAALLAKLPKDAGELRVLDSEQLSTAQKVARAIRNLPIVFTALLILLFGGAVYLARGRRREAVRGAGFGFIVAGVLALLVRELAGNSVTGSLAKTASVEPAVQAAWDIGTSLLVTVAASAIAFGILVVVAAWLAGRTAPAVALRREAAPYFRERQVAAYGVAAAIWLALIVWAPIAAFRKPFGILLFAVLFALGTEALRRQSIREFPSGEPGRFGRHARELYDRRRHNGSARGNGELAAPTQLEQLERLSSLRREGALSEDEFEDQKQRILA